MFNPIQSIEDSLPSDYRRPGRKPGRTRTVPVQVMLTQEEYEEWEAARLRSDHPTDMSSLVRQAMQELITRGTRYGYKGVAKNGAEIEIRRNGYRANSSYHHNCTQAQFQALADADQAISRNGPNDRARGVEILQQAGFTLTDIVID